MSQNSLETKIHVCCCINVCLILVAQILLAVFIYKQFSDGTDTYMSLLHNWQANAVTEFYIPQNDSQCQDGDTSIFTYTWPGTESGCRCYLDGSIRKHSCCSIFNNSDNCCHGETLDAISPKTFEHWGIGSQQKQSIKLCSKRLNGYNFREKIPKEFQCQENEKMCGGKTEQDKNYLFCVPKESNCPIQEIYFQQNQQGTLEAYPLQQGDLQINLYINRNASNKLPLTEFKVSQALEACWDDKQQYIPETTSTIDQRTSYCSTSKTRFTDTQFDIDEINYFLANDMDITKYNSIIPSKYHFHLLQKDYVNLDISCRNQIEPLYDNSDTINTVENLCLVLLILVALNQLFVVIFTVMRKYYRPQAKNLAFILKYCFKQIFLLVCIILAFCVSHKYITQLNLLEGYTNNNCFQGENKEMIESIQTKFNKGCIIALIFTLIYQLITDIELFLFFFGKCFQIEEFEIGYIKF